MTVAKKSLAAFDGDRQARATAGDCAAVAALIDRTGGFTNAAMTVPDDFNAEVEIYELGCLKLCHLTFKSPMKAVAEGRIDPRSSTAGYTNLMLLLSGVLAINLTDRCSMLLRPHDFCIMPKFDRFDNEALTPVEFISLLIPNEELVPVKRALQSSVERPISARSGSAHLLSQFIIDLVKQAPTLSASGRFSFSRALIQILRATINDLATSVNSAREQLYIIMCEIIERNLGNEDFSLSHVARELRCSKRFLHGLFSEYDDNHTFSSYLNYMRLIRCRSELQYQKYSGELISTIAHRWGFRDPSYFAKMFRREFGVSPRKYAEKVSSTTLA